MVVVAQGAAATVAGQAGGVVVVRRGVAVELVLAAERPRSFRPAETRNNIHDMPEF